MKYIFGVCVFENLFEKKLPFKKKYWKKFFLKNLNKPPSQQKTNKNWKKKNIGKKKKWEKYWKKKTVWKKVLKNLK